jgi:hypothetical protein
MCVFQHNSGMAGTNFNQTWYTYGYIHTIYIIYNLYVYKNIKIYVCVFVCMYVPA